MPKLLYAGMHRPGRSPGPRYRFEQFMPFLASKGFDITYAYFINEADDRVFYKPGNYPRKLWVMAKGLFNNLVNIKRSGAFDIVFVQREAFMLGTTVFEKLISRGKTKLVYDFDDAIWLPNVSEANKSFAFLKNPRKTSKLIAMADAVIAGNAFLADYARQFSNNVAIIPSTIDIEKYKVRPPQYDTEKITIGWSGSISTIPHFEMAVPVLKRIIEKYDEKIYIKVIGQGSYQHPDFNIKSVAWAEATEVAELAEFSIGIMPLPDEEWARGKCGMKGIQYMGMGIPTVMANVGTNKEIIVHGENGFLAGSEDEWFEALCRLVDSAELRNLLGAAGRKTVEDRYSVQSQQDKLANLLVGLMA